MSPGRARLPSQSAALAGVPAGVQAIGPWAGRRQLFVRFAAEAETATIYTAVALRGELDRLVARSRYHSIAIAGRDPLGEGEFLAAALGDTRPLPVMLTHDGQRPEALQGVIQHLDLALVRLSGEEGEGELERVLECVTRAASAKVSHAIAIEPGEGASDARLLRIVEQAHAASDEVAIVLHPTPESAGQADRRWAAWLERATGVHGDVRIFPRVVAPLGSA